MLVINQWGIDSGKGFFFFVCSYHIFSSSLISSPPFFTLFCCRNCIQLCQNIACFPPCNHWNSCCSAFNYIYRRVLSIPLLQRFPLTFTDSSLRLAATLIVAALLHNSRSASLVAASLQGPYQRVLLKELLRDYNPMERPVANDSQALTVQFSFTLMQVMDVVRTAESAT